MTKRKGITPVIAIVLLLLITVGAVGVVYTQFQSIVGNPGAQVAQQQEIRNTGMSFASLYKADNGTGTYYVNMTVSNTNSVAWNTSEFRLSYIPEGTGSAVSGSALDSTPFTYNSDEDNCFNDDSGSQIINPGETYTCMTGIQWPSPGEHISFVVDMANAGKSFGPETCDLQTSRSVGC